MLQIGKFDRIVIEYTYRQSLGFCDGISKFKVAIKIIETLSKTGVKEATANLPKVFNTAPASAVKLINQR